MIHSYNNNKIRLFVSLKQSMKIKSTIVVIVRGHVNAYRKHVPSVFYTKMYGDGWKKIISNQI